MLQVREIPYNDAVNKNPACAGSNVSSDVQFLRCHSGHHFLLRAMLPLGAGYFLACSPSNLAYKLFPFNRPIVDGATKY